ncbi:Teichoic acids export ATP-binding protein TagH [Polystyrenella longa]|uniref:Teichoic acids export ATP-binding protein TagH n=1 Tax=Polystyrenella longa TaxID=2528007 RepID=A0A518CIY8_9PLAN|nr:ABC transporter ATP-binding protein [Polystyrenella longa]QDU79196.1 Teichoic acids export ATP-binding protein TagH [Polystyrenella longa]
MTDLALRVEQLSKRYELGTREPYYALRDSLTRWFKKPFTREQMIPSAEANPHVWALDEVSFDVSAGEAVGILGHNGAGKSTLLKILSRVTEPTSGRATMYGRVGSLLEVGTGFHPELTGRENIFINGSILGMSQKEVRDRFDEIVAFAEIDRFLDTPVKRYSSGMYMRLAFSVAAHLQPEILLVDELLAVGDAAFQKKCLNRMGDVSRSGRTVLFVSHQMTAMKNLCQRGIYIDQGKLAYDGTIDEAINRYLDSSQPIRQINISDRQDRRGSGLVRFEELKITGPDGNERIEAGEELTFTFHYSSSDDTPRRLRFLVGIYDPLDTSLFRLDSDKTAQLEGTLPASGTIVCRTGGLNLTAGSCYVNIAVLAEGQIADHLAHAAEIEVQPADFYHTGRCFERNETLFLLEQDWSLDGN